MLSGQVNYSKSYLYIQAYIRSTMLSECSLINHHDIARKLRGNLFNVEYYSSGKPVICRCKYWSKGSDIFVFTGTDCMNATVTKCDETTVMRLGEVYFKLQHRCFKRQSFFFGICLVTVKIVHVTEGDVLQCNHAIYFRSFF
jgi:hypothetical protein